MQFNFRVTTKSEAHFGNSEPSGVAILAYSQSVSPPPLCHSTRTCYQPASLPQQDGNNTTAVERRSSRITLGFTQPYYLKGLRNGSAEGTVYLQYASGVPSGCWMNSEDAIKAYKAAVGLGRICLASHRCS